MPDPTPAETPEKWNDIGQQIFAGGLESFLKADLTKFLVAHGGQALGDLLAIIYTLLAPIGIGMAEGMAKAEDLIAPAFSDMAASAVNDVFDVGISSSTFAQPRGRGARKTAGEALGKGLMDQIRGNATTLEPSDEAAARYVGAMAQMALEDWFKGWFFEVLSSLVPQLDVGKIESYGALGDKVANVLGLGRLSNRVLRPIADAAIVTPLEWKINKTYRHKLLSAAEVVRQVVRGKWSRERGNEELARQGYSVERIDALFNAAAKFFSASDVRTFLSRNEWTNEQALQHLMDQGYTREMATDALRLEGLRRFDSLETQEANAIVGAYAARDIDRATFAELLGAAVSIESERHLFTELAEVRRSCNVKHLSIGQVEAMVKSGVANFRDYREAAEREGYDDGAVTLLELQLRFEIDKQKSIEKHRAELQAERDAAAAARAQALAAKKAAIEAERALARRGSETDLERAVVRGLIPIGRLVEVYSAKYDADTVEILAADVEADRLAYVAQQAARQAAEQRGARRNIDSGAVVAAFMAGIVTRDELRARLESLGYDAGDAELLTETAAARKADLDAAKAKRDEAAAAAGKRSIDLGRFEQLVRRGVRTLGEYDALLASLGFDEASRASMRELVELRIADDAAARQARAEAEAALKPRGLSLEQIRRAVILGVQSIADFERFLVAQRFTSDAQAVLLAELRADVAEAEAARARRETVSPVPQAPALSLSTIRRAAQLGIVTPAAYEARLVEAGYSDDDVAIELSLLIKEIADTQAARERAAGDGAAAAERELSLADVARAVKAGAATIDDYKARAIILGYSAADAELLGEVLARESATLAAARRRHDELAFSLAAAGVDLPALDARVKAGEIDVAEYRAQLQAWGSDDAEAELLAVLLSFTLSSSPAPPA